jgi:hypothetical protein
MKRICTIAVGLGILGLATAAKAVNVDFEGYKPGQTVEFAGFGNGIFAVNAVGNSGDASNATVLNTEATSDGNFKYKYATGNLKSSRLRKVLIVPTTDGSTTADPAGGQLTLTFFSPLKSFGFDALDVDVADAPNTFVTFRFQGQDLAGGPIPFSEFKKSSSPFKRTTVQWGNRSANRIAPFSAAQLGSPDGIDEVVFDFPSEFAVDNIAYRVNPIPEPTAVGLLLGLPALTMLRRRRRA